MALVLAGCATRGGPAADDGVGGAITQPLQDLNVVQDEIAPQVADAARAPYRRPRGCALAARERVRLDTALGPDVDAPSASSDGAERLAASVVEELLSLPFRGVVREVTGAEASERRRRQALLAASARRSFLKGWMRARGCARPTAPARDGRSVDGG